MNRRVRLFGGKNKNVDDVFAACIDQRGYILPTENIQAATDERKTLIRKILDGRDKSELAVEPGLDGVLVRRSDIHKVARLQGADVGVDDFGSGEGRSRRTVLGPGPGIPGDSGNKEERGSNSQPAPNRNARSHGRRCSSIEISPDSLAQRYGGLFVKAGTLQGAAQSFLGSKCVGAFPAALEVAFEFRGTGSVQFAIQVAMQDCARNVTAHGRPPVRREP
jgi:hypothetical protein